MNNEPNSFLVEARARIIWGDEPSAVRYYLTTNGMPAADADAKISGFILERNAEIRRLGVRDFLIGLSLLGGAGIFFLVCSMTSRIPITIFWPEGEAAMAFLALYGVWKLVKGIAHLLGPKSEHDSIPDLSE